MEEQGIAVLILPDKLPETTKSGLVIPKTVKEQPQTGLVVGCGPACTEVRIGDKVHFKRKSASLAMINEVAHYYITEDKILYIE